MPIYNCNFCNFSTKLKGNFSQHLNTKKHYKNKKSYEASIEKNNNSDHKVTILRPFLAHKVTNLRPINDHFCGNSNTKDFFCEHCNSGFSKKTHLYRHLRKYCKVLKKNEQEKNDLVKKIELENEKKDLEIEEHKKEKEKLYMYIEKLLESKQNNTTINIEKQLSHITDNMKLELLKLPYSMVQKMIELIHFNNAKPENKNIALTNKKEKMIKVFKDNKWRYKDKNETLDELIQINYGRLDEYFEKKASNMMSNTHNTRYKKYQDKFDSQEGDLMNIILKETEMIVLSENL
jgi:hypothetical protein